MCSPTCLQFGQSHLTAEQVKGKKVLEVGSLNVNGSLRGHIATLEPASYMGVDLSEGYGVDRIADVSALVEVFGKNSFDLVVSTEMLEHCRDWKAAITNMKRVLKPGGVILLTTRSQGFPFHEWPEDHWRYSVADMQAIFSDFEEVTVEPDPFEPGVFVVAKKPLKGWKPADLAGVAVHEVIAGQP